MHGASNSDLDSWLTVSQYSDEGFNATLKANDWTFEDALNNFTAVTHAALYKNNKTPFVWEEMVRTPA